MTRLVAGIKSLNLPSLFAAAERRIIFHASIYGPFADSEEHREGLNMALSKSSFQSLDIIALQSDQPWALSLMHTLRFDATDADKEKAILASTQFLDALQSAHSEKVRVYSQAAPPSLPIIVIDDTIIFGQYAHSDRYAADGYWGVTETDVDRLFQWAEDGFTPGNASSEEKAAYRLICECRYAMTGEA